MEETLSCRGGWRKNKVGRAGGGELMEKERREKNRQSISHSISVHWAPTVR